MQNAILKLFPRAKVKYTLIVRSKVDFPEGFQTALTHEIMNMRVLKLTDEEKIFFTARCKYIDESYFDFLSGYRYNPGEIGIIQNGGDLQLNITGYWYRTVLWEVPILALISELYFRMTKQKINSRVEREQNNLHKAGLFNMSEVKVSDFGTRRRYSYNNHKEVIEDLSLNMRNTFTGTSNVHFAHLFNLTPIGTHAHEWFMFHAAKYGFKTANLLSLEHWSDVYQGDLGIALSDTFTTDSFFRSFGKKYAKLFDGVRHDSGDATIFANNTIKHYESLGIDPTSKTIIFSDNLTPELAVTLQRYYMGLINIGFGIGTNLTNDVGVKPLNMVIKMTAAKPEENEEWVPTIKLSDTEGKHTGDEKMIDICKYQLNIK
jgi:nicotinate phosphoribosyltransferase